MYDAVMKQIVVLSRSLGAVLFALLILQGCNSLNPFCGSSRPAPTIASLSATSVSLAQIQLTGVPLTVAGSNFVAASVVIRNFDQGLIAETSVGLNAVAVANDRCR